MLIRIVKLTIQKSERALFLEIFNTHKSGIRHFPGCTHLEVLQDHSNDCIFYTYSHWEADEDLQNYRHSDFFGKLWPQLKAIFDDKPIAFSSYKIEEVV